MSTFPIRRVDRNRAKAVETLGSKPKFWFQEGERRLLFKAEDRGTGEDWAEVASCHFCELLGLPHVEYELAAEYDGERYCRPGVVCENMAPPPLRLVHGNELLLALDSDYPAAQRFKVRQHTVDAVLEIVGALAPPIAPWMEGVPRNIKTALDVFAGYVMLDAWIANQDRHHENWGALSDGDDIWLAPTFDHGAALARNLTDEERGERLSTRDRNRTILAFAKAGRSAFYRSAADARPLGTMEAFQAFGQVVPRANRGWLERLATVNRDALCGILERVPPERMSETCRRFTLELLLTNQQRLLE
ncbi:MAG: phosphatidylinositol kinase [Planctomycetia bacterium]|nr:phosphatidylinositol kinase [Planctomycetia bacterium]